jgi:hypothetical protein
MKYTLFILAIMITGCTLQKPAQKSSAPKINTEDSLQYELLVFDTGFDTWYTLKNSPALARGKGYYHDWNVRYVQAWNNKVMGSRHSGIFSDLINYEFNVDYPYEIEHELFYYFQYIEQELHVPILKQGPQAVF